MTVPFGHLLREYIFQFLRKLGEKKYADPIKFCFHVNFTPRSRGLFRILRKVSLGQYSEFFGSAGKYRPEDLSVKNY